MSDNASFDQLPRQSHDETYMKTTLSGMKAVVTHKGQLLTHPFVDETMTRVALLSNSVTNRTQREFKREAATSARDLLRFTLLSRRATPIESYHTSVYPRTSRLLFVRWTSGCFRSFFLLRKGSHQAARFMIPPRLFAWHSWGSLVLTKHRDEGGPLKPTRSTQYPYTS